MDNVTLWDADGLRVWVKWGDDRKLVFQGQRLSGGGEYEYAISVRPEDVPRLVAGLDGPPGADVIALIKANAEAIVRQGEQTWIVSLGITPDFWSHSSD